MSFLHAGRIKCTRLRKIPSRNPRRRCKTVGKQCDNFSKRIGMPCFDSKQNRPLCSLLRQVPLHLHYGLRQKKKRRPLFCGKSLLKRKPRNQRHLPTPWTHPQFHRHDSLRFRALKETPIRSIVDKRPIQHVRQADLAAKLRCNGTGKDTAARIAPVNVNTRDDTGSSRSVNPEHFGTNDAVTQIKTLPIITPLAHASRKTRRPVEVMEQRPVRQCHQVCFVPKPVDQASTGRRRLAIHRIGRCVAFDSYSLPNKAVPNKGIPMSLSQRIGGFQQPFICGSFV